MINEIITGVILLSIGGLGFLAYNNRDGYKNLAKIIGLATIIAYTIVGAFKIIIESIIDEIARNNVQYTHKSLMELFSSYIPNMTVITTLYFLLMAMLLFFYRLPELTKKNKIK